MSDLHAFVADARAKREALLKHTGCYRDWHPRCPICRAGEAIYRLAQELERVSAQHQSTEQAPDA